jgi:Domain of unknown function (DUF4270)
MYTNSFFNTLLFVSLTISLGSCDKDYNTIGGDLVENNHFGLDSLHSEVIAYTQKTGAVQTNDLPVNAFGILDNGLFGKTTASFATQVVLATENPIIGTNPYLKSVVLTIPYYVDPLQTKSTTTVKEGISETNSTYVLDSIYGNDKAKMRLSVYESGYFMKDTDPLDNFNKPKYFSDQTDFESNKIGDRLNNSTTNKAENDQFFFDNSEHTDSLKLKTPPRMELNLDKQYFKTKIFDAIKSGNLRTNEFLKNYFRGLYFKIEKNNETDAQLSMLNFKGGKITLKYNEDLIGSDGKTIRVEKSIVFNLTGSTASLLKTDNSTIPETANKTAGDAKLYLKGGEGAMAILSLFNNPSELQTLKDSKAKINEANIVFNIDIDAMKNTAEPNRIYLYDLTNNRPISDYSFDGSTISASPKKGKYIYNGIIKRIAKDDKGISYTINITNHIRNIVQNGAENVKLGLVVTEDINNPANLYWKTPMKYDPSFTNFIQIPSASVMNPLGTVLFGSNIPSSDTQNYNKRLKLHIYYTKPN